jgi:hypothetical protein
VADERYNYYYFLITPGFNDARQECLVERIGALGGTSECEIVDYSGVTTGVVVTHEGPGTTRLLPYRVLDAIGQCIGGGNYQVIEPQPGADI